MKNGLILVVTDDSEFETRARKIKTSRAVQFLADLGQAEAMVRMYGAGFARVFLDLARSSHLIEAVREANPDAEVLLVDGVHLSSKLAVYSAFASEPEDHEDTDDRFLGSAKKRKSLKERLLSQREEYMLSLESRLPTMKRELELARGGDSEALAQLKTNAHQIHGTAATLGLGPVGELCAMIEGAINDHGEDGKESTFEVISTLLDRAQIALASAEQGWSPGLDREMPKAGERATILAASLAGRAGASLGHQSDSGEEEGLAEESSSPPHRRSDAEVVTSGVHSLWVLGASGDLLRRLQRLGAEAGVAIFGEPGDSGVRPPGRVSAIVVDGRGSVETASVLARRARDQDMIDETAVAFVVGDSREPTEGLLQATYAGASSFLREKFSLEDLKSFVADAVRAFEQGNPTVLVDPATGLIGGEFESALWDAGYGVRELRGYDPSHVAAKSPNLLVLGVTEDAFELTRVIKSGGLDCDPPILFVTEDSSSSRRARCFEAGADDYVVKPLVATEAVGRARLLLERIADGRLKLRDRATGLLGRAGFARRVSDLVNAKGALILFEFLKTADQSVPGDELAIQGARLLRSRMRIGDVRGMWTTTQLAVATPDLSVADARKLAALFIAEFDSLVRGRPIVAHAVGPMGQAPLARLVSELEAKLKIARLGTESTVPST